MEGRNVKIKIKNSFPHVSSLTKFCLVQAKHNLYLKCIGQTNMYHVLANLIVHMSVLINLKEFKLSLYSELTGRILNYLVSMEILPDSN